MFHLDHGNHNVRWVRVSEPAGFETGVRVHIYRKPSCPTRRERRNFVALGVGQNGVRRFRDGEK